jgi:peroxiredoxin
MARPTSGMMFELPRALCERLSDHHRTGWQTLVVFYRGHWCDYCNAQLAELVQTMDSFALLETQVVGITTDDQAGIDVMRERIESSFPLFSDTGGEAITTLDLVDPFEFKAIPVSLPAVFLIDSGGVVRFHYVGKSPDDRPRTELLLLAAERLSMEKC